MFSRRAAGDRPVQPLETELLYAEFHPRGAALARLIYKPLDLDLVIRCTDGRDAPNHYLNTVVGPVANRIANARFDIDNETFELDRNEGSHCLHGGTLGLSELEWRLAGISNTTIRYTLTLQDRHMGFPGPAHFQADYTLARNRLSIALHARSPRPNYFNLTPHLYFNLDGSDRIDTHHLHIDADHYLPTDATKCPTGVIQAVDHSRFDFRTPQRIASDQIDHNFCLNGNGWREVATLFGVNDLGLKISTDQQGLQIHTAEHLGRSHLAAEVQAWPNAINEAIFPSQITRPGEIYRSTSAFEVTHSAPTPL